jgi:hypothetical protein
MPRLPPDPRVVAYFGEPLVGGIRNQTMRPQKFRSGIKVYVEIQKRIPYLKIKISELIRENNHFLILEFIIRKHCTHQNPL